MRRRPSLRFRVAIAFAALSAGTSLVFALGVWVIAHGQSQRLLDQTLNAELDDYAARRVRNPGSLPPDSASLRVFVAPRSGGETPVSAAPPLELAGLPIGQFEVVLNDVPYRVGVADRGDDRYFILFDESRQRAREQRFVGFLAAGVVLMTILAALGGSLMAARAIAPVSDLARAVSDASAERPLPLAGGEGRDDEIGELTRAFRHYVDRTAAFVERERAFAADASHELRTPLAVIGGAVEVLSEDPGLTEGQAERVARIARAVHDMSDLIAALLLLAREERTQDDESCDAAQAVRQVADHCGAAAKRRGIALAVAAAADVELPVAPALFSIVVANLVRNAIAHTEHGSVDVRLYADRLVVADTGPGIDEEAVDLVFQRYYRGARSEGSGIGLSLVKRICDRQRWLVQLENRPGGGTLATLQFAPPA